MERRERYKHVKEHINNGMVIGVYLKHINIFKAVTFPPTILMLTVYPDLYNQSKYVLHSSSASYFDYYTIKRNDDL